MKTLIATALVSLGLLASAPTFAGPLTATDGVSVSAQANAPVKKKKKAKPAKKKSHKARKAAAQ